MPNLQHEMAGGKARAPDERAARFLRERFFREAVLGIKTNGPFIGACLCAAVCWSWYGLTGSRDGLILACLSNAAAAVISAFEEP
jgi:hypothetical protein